MKKYFKDFYGATASIQTGRDGKAKLSVTAGGKRTVKTYSTELGARIAMGRMSDCWKEVKQ